MKNSQKKTQRLSLIHYYPSKFRNAKETEKMLKKRVLKIIKLTLVVALLLFLYRNSNSRPDRIIREMESESLSCEPFSHTRHQYRVRMDNESYPKRVPLLHNTSINFQCLNRYHKTVSLTELLLE
jgi:hypothetical protein